MKDILVVCEANICRSPMAQGLLASSLPDVRVHSAGLNALSGMPADATAVRLLSTRGIDITGHRARQITRELCRRAELVLVMSTDQRKRLERDYPFATGRVFRLCEFLERDVSDPYGQTEIAFHRSLQLMDEGVREWLKRIDRVR
jgi:protein-tyrosine phosphatase